MAVFICTSNSVERGNFSILKTTHEVVRGENADGATEVIMKGKNCELGDALIAFGLVGTYIEFDNDPTLLYLVNPLDLPDLQKSKWFQERFNGYGNDTDTDL